MSKVKFDASVYLILIQYEFKRRKEANKRYSLRAYAKSLGVDASHLSKVLNAKALPSKHLIAKFNKRLGKSLEPLAKTEHPFPINQATEHKSSTWRHFAILSLLDIPDFKPDIEWIAGRLGCEKRIIQSCVQDIFSDGILKADEQGQWVANVATVSLTPGISPAAAQAHQKELLEKALETYEAGPRKRAFSSSVIAIHPDSLDLARLLTRHFRRMMMDILPHYQQLPNEVYCLQVGLFPLSGNSKPFEEA